MNDSLISSQAKWRTLDKENILRSYKEISDYAIIGDQRTCALIGIDASIDWFCTPRFDSPSIFGSILDVKKGGSFKILPAGEKRFSASQHYDGLTNVLITEFKTKSAHVQILDFMPCFEVQEVMISTGEIHRQISCLEGKLALEIIVDPRMNYGREIPKMTPVRGIGYSFNATKGETRQEIALITPLKFRKKGSALQTEVTMNAQDPPLDLGLRYGGVKLHNSEKVYTDDKLRATRTYWSKWLTASRVSGKWKDHVLRSALVLKLLIYSPTGAIVAAPTTSLPEEIGGVRNWDYRFSWIRDSSFVLWALHSLGHDEVESSYLNWLTSIFYMMAENLQVMLGVSGERDLRESSLKHLSGYKNSSPVRIGNGAHGQFQLDVYGILLDALYFSHKHGSGISKELYEYLIRLVVKAVEENWQKPDCGIWEVRGERKNFVYSKMWCWVALDRAVKIANSLGKVVDANEWSKLRDEIKQTILAKGYDKSLGSFVRSFGSKDLDAANLLMPQVGFIKATDPMMLSTINQTKKKLKQNAFLYRYLTDDGLPGDEGAFLMCSFWLVSCLTLAGELEEAEKLLDSLVKYSNHVGLFSEEIDPKTGSMLGNFPQAFTHMGFITAATGLSKAIEERNLKSKS